LSYVLSLLFCLVFAVSCLDLSCLGFSSLVLVLSWVLSWVFGIVLYLLLSLCCHCDGLVVSCLVFSVQLHDELVMVLYKPNIIEDLICEPQAIVDRRGLLSSLVAVLLSCALWCVVLCCVVLSCLV
jgi:hypothetical protein